MLDKSFYRLVPFQPVWEPFNSEAEAHCSAVFVDLGLECKGATGSKNRLLAASFLYAANSIRRKHPTDHDIGYDALPIYLGVSRKATAWSQYPLVGKDLSLAFIDRLIAVNWIAKVEGSGDRGFVQDELTGKWTANPTMTMYHLEDSVVFDGVSGIEKFLEVGRPLLKVNGPEARAQREVRKAKKLAKPIMASKDCKQKFRGEYIQAGKRVQALNEFWIKHPLALYNGNAAACATRVFHDGRIDAGGRFYGSWTGLEGPLRLRSTIGEEQVCQIDIKGSQPTLLSALLGIKMNGVSGRGTWIDCYTQITGLWQHGGSSEDMLAAAKDPSLPDLFVRSRAIAKRVVMELIGTGNADKVEPSSELIEEQNVTKAEWDFFKSRLIDAIPALTKLEPRYDASGQVSGYINGPGFLSYHESEMVLQTIETLHGKGVPAYPMHDCLIIKECDAQIAIEAIRATICQYCYDLTGSKVLVPLTIENSDGMISHHDLNLHEDDIMGTYL
jgi:hypothetical protein